ncbi:MAG TPA: PRC-barrel domain-containing protein [Gemmatimonadaceae bacterium]|nr:PRC-barrel domain-containing protein [Gemmatimonadaceae bacterium]
MTRKKDERDGLDLAGVGPDPKETRHLAPLRELGRYRIGDGEPDIRGWHVFTSSGRDLGEVDDLLVDTERGEVVMLDIDLEGTDRHSLAPIRAAWVDRDAKRVVLDGARFDADVELPSLGRGPVSDEDARRFARQYADVYGDRAVEHGAEYRIRRADEELRVARRRAEHEAQRADEQERARHEADQRSRDAERAADERAREAEHKAKDATEGAREAAREAARDDVVVERRAIPADERRVTESSEEREVRYPARERPQDAGHVVEEVVVRRRVLDRDVDRDAGRDAPGAP